MTILDSLRSINSYPIPTGVQSKAAVGYGLNLEEEVTTAVLESTAYRLAEVDVYVFLAGAPDVTQNGVTFSFTDEQRKHFLSISSSIKQAAGVDDATTGQGYGYIGEDY